ncbi:MAG: hypothetical protein ABI142_07080 [Bryocella sp.]
MPDISTLDFDHMTPTEFSDCLPELFASSSNLSSDPRLTKFFAANPDAAGLVRDLEAIADAARGLFEPEADAEPSDALWSKIASKLGSESPED